MNPDQWGRFCGALGDAAMETDPRFATNNARLEHHPAFKARVEAILATGSAKDWVARLEAAGIAAGPIYEFHEVFEDPQVRHLGLVAEVEQPRAGKGKMLAFPGRAPAPPPPSRWIRTPGTPPATRVTGSILGGCAARRPASAGCSRWGDAWRCWRRPPPPASPPRVSASWP